MSNLLDFINNNKKDWKEILSKETYSIKIKKDEDYYLLKYNQLTSDFSIDIVRECRGCIIRYSEALNKYVFVCRPFDKFFNYNELKVLTT